MRISYRPVNFAYHQMATLPNLPTTRWLQTSELQNSLVHILYLTESNPSGFLYFQDFGFDVRGRTLMPPAGSPFFTFLQTWLT